MAETKRCPYCGEEILAVAKKCKYCGEWLDKPAVSGVKGATTPTDNRLDSSSNVLKGFEVNHNEASAEERRKRKGFFQYYFTEAWTNKSNEKATLVPGFEFSGTMPRKQFWIASIILSITCFLYLCLFELLTVHQKWLKFFVIILYILWCVKAIEMQVKRLHDIGKSGWLVLLNIVPVVNLYLIYLYCQKGSNSQATEWNKKDSISLFLTILAFIVLYIVTRIMAA